MDKKGRYVIFCWEITLNVALQTGLIHLLYGSALNHIPPGLIYLTYGLHSLTGHTTTTDVKWNSNQVSKIDLLFFLFPRSLLQLEPRAVQG